MRLKDYLAVTGLTIISPLIFGYYYGVLDHHHYLPYLNKLMEPGLYQSDYYFSQPHFNYSSFNYFIVWLKQALNLDLSWIHLILYFVSLWWLYFSVYFLAKTIYRRSAIGLTAAVLFLQPKWAAQIGYLTHHFYFVSRDLSLAISLIALTFVLKKKPGLSISLLALAATVNPSIPIPVALFWLAEFLPRLKTFNLSLFSTDQQWLEVLKRRGTYSFPHLWDWTGWGNFGLYLALMGTSWLVLRGRLFGEYLVPVRRFLFICSGLFLFHFLISAIVPIPQLIQLQFLRAVNYIFVFSLVALAAGLNFLWSRSNLYVSFAAISALIGVYLWADHLTGWHFIAILILPALWLIKFKSNQKIKLISLPAFLAIMLFSHLMIKLLIVKPQINLPFYWHYPNTLINLPTYQDRFDLQIWAAGNTAKDEIFLIPPGFSGFRSFSKRSIVADQKDGGVIFYSPQYAQDWNERVKNLVGYSQFGLSEFQRLAQIYSFDYVVVTKNHPPLDLPLVYENRGFRVYKM